MELNEIKKLLYRHNPFARLDKIKNGVAYYISDFAVNDGSAHVSFDVPVSDMGEAAFLPTMQAKLLIRWIAL